MIRNSRRVVAFAIAGAVAIAPVISGCGAGETPQSAAPTQLTEAVNASVPQGDKVSKIDIRNMFLLGPEPDKVFPQGSSLPLYATLINQVKAQDRLVSVTSPDFAQVQISGGALTMPPAQPDGAGSAVSLVGPSSAATPGAKPTGKATKPTTKPTGETSPSPGGTSPSPGATGTQAPSGAPGATGSPGAAASPSAPSSATPTAPATGTPTAPGAATGKAPLVVLSGLTRELRGGETVKVKLQFEQAGSVEVSVPVIPQQGEFATYAPVSTGVPVPGAASTPATTPSGATEHGGAENGTPTQGGGHGTTAPTASESPASHG
ncbi:hypothetical protein [Actinomadura rudentiformis]|uniref:Copper chaperone PCu(A)C n=1 Tax=Actinomadura rudentiformis TaxID=359158 RepID=A0A6H9YP26_9ACTN|nr:hypothetical protein [Actinomadura rudentiformis]KAB2347945.1 hypothetical protein F8566_18875 [Actinomadura rudentiformis]